MRAALWFFIKVALLIALVLWMVDHPGTVTVTWMGWIVDLPLLLTVVGGVALVLLFAHLYHWWRDLLGLPRLFGRNRRTRRQERGYEAVNEGLVSVAAGDIEQARYYTRKAQSLVPEAPLALLLQAQTAQLAGDEQAAGAFFATMAQHPKTAFLGLRGMMQQALRSGDLDQAITLAEKARNAQPRAGWAHLTLFDLQVRRGLFTEAEKTMKAAMEARAVDLTHGHEQIARLLLTRAEQDAAAGNHAAADELIRRAYDESGQFVPAIVAHARALTRQGKPKPASKVIEQAWRRVQHADLARAYADIQQGESPTDRFKRFQRLADMADGVENDLMLAAAAIAAREWAVARLRLDRCLEKEKSARLYRLLALLAEGETGDYTAAQDWRAKADALDSEFDGLRAGEMRTAGADPLSTTA
jgi:HemY protein